MTVGFSPSTQIVDPKTGYLTREGVNLFSAFVEAANNGGGGSGDDSTLTGSRIDGDDNTIVNIATASLKRTSGDSLYVVTGRGTAGFVAQWDAAGNAGDGPQAISLLTSDDAMATYLPTDGTMPMLAPIKLAPYTVAGVPAAASYPGGLIYVTDESGGPTVAASDGANWLRASDNAVIS